MKKPRTDLIIRPGKRLVLKADGNGLVMWGDACLGASVEEAFGTLGFLWRAYVKYDGEMTPSARKLRRRLLALFEERVS